MCIPEGSWKDLVSSSSNSTGVGCYGTDMAEASSVHLSPDRSVFHPCPELQKLWVWPLRGRSSWLPVSQPRLLRPYSNPELPQWGNGTPLSGNFSLHGTETTISTQSTACPVGTVLEFLQASLSAGLTHSTLKVYVAAKLTYHASLGGQSVGKNPLVTRFLHGAMRLSTVSKYGPPVRSCIPSRDLAVVLKALCRPPFEPIEEISDPHLTLKTVFILAISSLKRVVKQALSVAPTHLDFAPGMAKILLYPRAGYVPKVPSVTPQPVILQAFSPPPFREPDWQKLICMCLVQTLDTYVHRAAPWRKADQLLICYGPLKRGLPASKQTLSRWFLDAINMSYESSDLPLPMVVKAHSTRSVVASKAFFAGVPLQDICDAAGWSTPLTFVRFYGLDIRATPGSAVHSSVHSP